MPKTTANLGRPAVALLGRESLINNEDERSIFIGVLTIIYAWHMLTEPFEALLGCDDISALSA